VHPCPHQRLAAAKTFAHRFQQRGCGPDLLMTVHAGLSGGNAGKTRNFDRSVAIAAIDAEPRHMMLVAERHWLRFGDGRVSHVRRALELDARPKRDGRHKYRSKNCGPRDCVSTAMKDLHLSKLS